MAMIEAGAAVARDAETGLMAEPRDEAMARGPDGAAMARARLTNFHLFVAVAAVFLLSNAIFASALRVAPMAVVLLGVALLGGSILKTPRGAFLSAAIDARTFLISAAFATALCVLGGQGHFFFSQTDWLVRDAVLHDLVADGFRVVYRFEQQDYLLRAPLGLYMLPAVVGWTFGHYASHLAMLAQNAFLTSAIVYFVLSLARVRQTPMLLLFAAFSGADLIGVAAAEAVSIYQGDGFMPFRHIEWWLNFFTDIRLQFSSHVTQLFWVPNHMAPGWWFGVLALLHGRREIDVAAVAGSFAFLLIWSPLAMIGALPFVLLFAAEARSKLLEPRALLAGVGGLCLVPIALYLSMDAAAIKQGWLIGRDHFAFIYVAVIAIELPQIAIVAARWRLVEPCDRPSLALAIATLLLVPLYSLGPFNDLSMRASITPLFLLAFAFCRIATLTPRDNGSFATMIGVIVILSVATPMLELHEAFNRPYAISSCNMITSWHKTFRADLPLNYWARVEKTPSWLMTPSPQPPLTLEARKCWPDHPLLSDAMK